jgi:putative membrane protein
MTSTLWLVFGLVPMAAVLLFERAQGAPLQTSNWCIEGCMDRTQSGSGNGVGLSPITVVLATLGLVADAVTSSGCERHTMALPRPATAQAATSARGAVTAGGQRVAENRSSVTGGKGGRGEGAVAGTAGAAGSPGSFHMVAPGVSARAIEEDPPSTSAVLAKLHESNVKGIEMGKLAEKKGTSKEVKNYGTMLVRDHRVADKKIMDLAKTESIQIPSGTYGPGAKDWQAAPQAGSGFDVAFAKDMLTDHRHDIAELKKCRDGTKDEKLKSLLNDLLPTLEKHERVAQTIVDREGRP